VQDDAADGSPDDGSPTRVGPASTERWGTRGVPLLPWSLRDAFGRRALPAPVASALGLPPGSAVAALDASVWNGFDRLPDAATAFALAVVGSRSARDVRIMSDPWPAEVPPEDVAWPTRLGRTLRTGGFLVAGRLERVTYGQLLAIPTAGRRSALELGTIVDRLATPVGDHPDAAIRAALVAASGEAWAARIDVGDPRLRDVVTPRPGRFDDVLAAAAAGSDGRPARALARALPAVAARVVELGREPLDDAIPGLCEALGISPRDLAITVARLGRRGRPHRLRDVGEAFSISKERVRQIVDRTTDRLDHAFLPQVGRAARLLADEAPMTIGAAARLLADRSLSTEPFDPHVVAVVADLTGYPAPFVVDSAAGIELVLTDGAVDGAVDGAAIMASVGRLSRRSGVFTVRQVVDGLATGDRTAGDGAATAIVSLVLGHSPVVAHLRDGWYWRPADPDGNGLGNATRPMLAVSTPLGLDQLRRGLVRRRHGVRVADVPPIDVLVAFFDAHPAFIVDGGAIRSAEALDAGAALTRAEQAFVAAFGAAPDGRLHRADLERAVTAAGIDQRLFTSVITYTAILEHPARDVWQLRR
jgi:hypothetical protein